MPRQGSATRADKAESGRKDPGSSGNILKTRKTIKSQSMSRKVPIHHSQNIDKARTAGKLAAEVLQMIAPFVQPGVTTEELDRRCREYIINVQKAIPANIGYHGYPKTLCTSVNQVICHGIPSPRQRLKDGDIVNLDIAVIKDGWFGDTSRMYLVGQTSSLARRLVRTTHEAMMAGIRQVRPGATLGDIGFAIQTVAQREGFSVVREYCGHGIGKVYHDEPQVLHYGRQGAGLRLQTGMLFTIEPMINAGRRETRVLSDDWTVETRDQSLSAQWEHMVAVTEDGFEILTPWPDGDGEYADTGANQPA
jgi:methionyl aminopeptidase